MAPACPQSLDRTILASYYINLWHALIILLHHQINAATQTVFNVEVIMDLQLIIIKNGREDRASMN